MGLRMILYVFGLSSKFRSRVHRRRYSFEQSRFSEDDLQQILLQNRVEILFRKFL